MSYQDDYLHEPEPDFGKTLATAFGVALLAFGIIFSIWAVVIAVQMIKVPVEQVAEPGATEAFLIEGMYDGDEWRLSANEQTTYLLTRMVMIAVMVSVGTAFIRGGAQLLTGSLKKLRDRFGRLDTDLRQHMRTISDKVDKLGKG